MMGSRILLFLVGALGDFLTFLLLLRFLMQAARVSFSSPVGEFVLALTNWLVRPLRRLIPGLLGLDWASLLPAWLVQALVVGLTLALAPAPVESGLPLAFAVGLLETLRIGIWVMIIALIAAAVLSWVNPYSPLAHPVMQLCRPLLRPIQRVVPPLSRIDLSPLIAILLLQVVLIVLDSLRPSFGALFL